MVLWKYKAGCRCYACCEQRDLDKGLIDISNFIFNDNAQPESSYFIVCSVCGNKRCPHATNHAYACTNSNDSGQEGSRYEK
jgi:hypothetical protein